MYFNSHAPRGARRDAIEETWQFKGFQLTRPARGAASFVHSCLALFIFQLTRPARGAAFVVGGILYLLKISTHTPREGRGFVRCYYP